MQQDRKGKANINNGDENPLEQSFWSDLSHDLRTPMSAILGFSNLLMQSKLDESQYKFTQSIYEAADNLLGIINNILDYSKIESGTLNIDKRDFKLKDLAYRLKNRIERNPHRKTAVLLIEIDEKLPDFLRSDVQRMEQVMMHLMGQMVRFSTKGQVELELRIELQSYKEKTVKVRFEITDANAGIQPENFKHLLPEDMNPGDISGSLSELGLGFLITKKLIDLLNGSLTIRSNHIDHNRDQRVTFLCDFACEVGQSTEVDTKIDNGGALKDARILVCEDNILSQELTKEILRRLGSEVVIAENGHEGLKVLQKNDHTFDCVLMDIQMPVMDGIETTLAIRKLNKPYRDIPVIALTAQSVNEEKSKYLDAGINDYITKPFTPQEISEKVLKYISTKSADFQSLDNDAQGNNIQNDHTTSHTLFDLDFLKDAFGDNPAIFQELLQVLANQFLQFKKDASQGLLLKNWKMLAQAAQVIKVNLRAFGLKSLENKVTLIEQSASKKENLDEIPELIRDCEEIFAGAIKELNSLLEDGNNSEG